MAIFAVISHTGISSASIHQALASRYPMAHLPLIDGTAWLVAHSGSAQELSGKLGITDGSNGPGLVFEIGSYYGRANPDIWAWIKAKWEATSGG